jgi:tight adherence protein C
MARNEKVSLRTSPKAYMQTVVEQFNLSKWVGQEAARSKLMQAGYRGQGPYVAFLFFRMIVPLTMLVGSLIYVFFLTNFADRFNFVGASVFRYAWIACLGIGVALLRKARPAAFFHRLGFMAGLAERRSPACRSRPRSGVSAGDRLAVDRAVRKELTLTTAELSYLPDRPPGP